VPVVRAAQERKVRNMNENGKNELPYVGQAHEKQFHITRLTEAEEKCQWAPSLRGLWRECFGDPEAYEDFYFSNVYKENVVYGVKDRGMLHLNPYPCKVLGKEMTLHYIVGVATAPYARRKGIMGGLLTQALEDMYENQEPFTYLMPADVTYYEPFDFVSICEKQEQVWRLASTDICLSQIRFVTYEQVTLEWDEKQQAQLFSWMEEMLSRQNCVYAVHDRAYFDLLYREKKCQRGNVVFCFDEEIEEKNFLGFFAYGMEGEDMYVEQCMFWQNVSEEIIPQCFYRYMSNTGALTIQQEEMNSFRNRLECGEKKLEGKTIHRIVRFPYMLRIVNVEKFLDLFKNYFIDFALEKKVLCVRDFIIPENNGLYCFYEKNGEIHIKKKRLMEGGEKHLATKSEDELIILSVTQMADYVCRHMKKEQKGIFFAEVV
jgi:predicted acetyltransferase